MAFASWFRTLKSRFERTPARRARPTRSRRRPSVRPCLESLEDRTVPATFLVTTTVDGGAGSLRQAILDANASPGADTIEVPAGGYTLTLTGAGEDAGATGDLDITGDLTIHGAGDSFTNGGNPTYLNAAGLDRVFQLLGGIYIASGALTVTHCTLRFCSAAGDVGSGGGIYAAGGTVMVTDSDLRDNLAFGSTAGLGGGISTTGGNPTLVNSTITDNFARSYNGAQGGGIYSEGAALTVSNSTFVGNLALGGLSDTGGDGRGGGMYIGSGTATLSNIQVTGNFAVGGTNFSSGTGAGGGIYAANSTLAITNSTLSNNVSVHVLG